MMQRKEGTMIKAEDLRIGDLVKINENCSLKEGVISYITEIRTRGIFEKEDFVKVKHFDSDWEFGVWCCNIDPIPLTPEILEKNGWKLHKHHKRNNYDDVSWSSYHKPAETNISLRFYPEEKTFFLFLYTQEISETPIRYIHQFQHILWALYLDTNLKILE